MMNPFSLKLGMDILSFVEDMDTYSVFGDGMASYGKVGVRYVNN